LRLESVKEGSALRLTHNEWHEWQPDGVTVRSFSATLDGSVITLRATAGPLAVLEAPTKDKPWTESPPIEYQGSSLVLAARRWDAARILCDLFEDGRALRTGKTLEEARAAPPLKRLNPTYYGVLLITWSPAMATIAMIRQGLLYVTIANAWAWVFAILVTLGASLVFSRLGHMARAAVEKSGQEVGAKTALIVIAVVVATWAVPAILVAGPMHHMLGGN
jgi:hypothetical protein